MTFTVDGLTMNAWQACVHYCDEIEKEGYQLQPDYAFNFSVHNETSVENIFTIPMDKIKYQNQFWYLYRSRHYAHGGAIGMDAENGTSATLATVHAFGYGTDSLDTRFAINFYADTVKVDGKVVTLESGEPLVYQPLVMAENLTYSPYEKTAGARMAKYEIDRKAYAANCRTTTSCSSVSPTCCSCAPRQKCETEKTDRVIWMLYAVAWACPAAPQRSTTSCVSGCSN